MLDNIDPMGMNKAFKPAAVVLAMVLSAGMLTGCAEIAGAVVGEALGAIAEAVGSAIVEGIGEAAARAGAGAGTATRTPAERRAAEMAAAQEEWAKREAAAAEAGRKLTLNEVMSYYRYEANHGFDIPADERLTRRTSSLAGGTPVDVSPYLILHESSFAVLDDTIQYSRLAVDVYGPLVSGDKYYYYEFDITVTYEANNQAYRRDVTAVTFDENERKAKRKVSDYMRETAAQGLELSEKDLKKFKAQFNNTRRTRRGTIWVRFAFRPAVLVQEIEPCYYQFDVEFEYQRTEPETSKKGPAVPKGPADFTVVNKTYRSDFTSLAAATFDIQMAVWHDTFNRKAGKRARRGAVYVENYSYLPIINVVRAVKFTE
jgi:hypothetical protein